MSGGLGDLVDRFEILERLEAIIAELGDGGDGPDVAIVIAMGLLEELEIALEDEPHVSGGLVF